VWEEGSGAASAQAHVRLRFRPGRPALMPLRSSRANPPTACCALGCACRDSGSSAANTFIKKGSVSPKRPRAVAPSCPFGSAAQGVQQKLVALVGHLPGGIARVRAQPQLSFRGALWDWVLRWTRQVRSANPCIGPYRSA
jgi:hypothetical protein